MKKKTQYKKKIVRKKKKKLDSEVWVMPFDASFPGGGEFEFDFEPQNPDIAVLFQYEKEDEYA